MRLGDLFSEAERKAYVRRNFRVGVVFYLYCDFTYDTKDKYFLVLDPSDPPLCLIISSEIPAFYRKWPHFRDCQVKLKLAENPGVIEKDCHVDCTSVYDYFSYADIEAQVLNNPSRIRGHLGMERLIEIREALDRDERIPAEDKARILMRLDALLP